MAKLATSSFSVTLRIPKLTPGAILKPPMAKLTRHEIALKEHSERGKNGKAPHDSFDQVGLVMLPDQVSLDSNNWWVTNFSVKLPRYLGNGMIVNGDELKRYSDDENPENRRVTNSVAKGNFVSYPRG